MIPPTLRNGTIFSDFGEPGCMSVTASVGVSTLIIEDMLMTCGFSGLTATNWDDMTIRRNVL